jgi:hypothetical protein
MQVHVDVDTFKTPHVATHCLINIKDRFYNSTVMNVLVLSFTFKLRKAIFREIAEVASSFTVAKLDEVIVKSSFNPMKTNGNAGKA